MNRLIRVLFIKKKKIIPALIFIRKWLAAFNQNSEKKHTIDNSLKFYRNRKQGTRHRHIVSISGTFSSAWCKFIGILCTSFPPILPLIEQSRYPRRKEKKKKKCRKTCCLRPDANDGVLSRFSTASSSQFYGKIPTTFFTR